MEQKQDVTSIFKGKNPFISPQRLKRIVEIIEPILHKNYYESICLVPGSRSTVNAPLPDILNLITAITGSGDSTLRSSISPGFYEKLLGLHSRECAILYKLFQRNAYVTHKKLLHVFTQAEINELLSNCLLLKEEQNYFSLLKINVVEKKYFLSSVANVTPGEFIYLGCDSYILAEALMRLLKTIPCGKRTLDLCTGSGVQGILASSHFEEVIGVDINPNSPLIASANSHLNDRNNCYFILSDLYEHVTGLFDLIIANPPYVFSKEHAQDLGLCGDGKGKFGMEIPLRIIEGWDKYLTKDGIAIMITTSPVVDGQDLLFEAIKEQFKSFSMAFEFIEVATHIIHKGLYKEHSRLGINHSIFYIIKAKKTHIFSINKIHLTKLHHLIGWLTKQQNIIGSSDYKHP